ENLCDDARRQFRAALTPEARFALDRQPLGRGYLAKRGAGLEPAGDFCGLGIDAFDGLVLAKARLDPVLELVELALARRRYLDHIVPDEAAARERKRLVLIADLGVKSTADHVSSCRQIGDRLALGRPPGAIDRLDGAHLQIELLADLFELRATAEF